MQFRVKWEWKSSRTIFWART